MIYILNRNKVYILLKFVLNEPNLTLPDLTKNNPLLLLI